MAIQLSLILFVSTIIFSYKRNHSPKFIKARKPIFKIQQILTFPSNTTPMTNEPSNTEHEKKQERMHTSLKVSLKEIRCPSFSVSTSTPSQSKRRADGRAEEEEEAEQVNPLEPFLKLVGLVVDVFL